jgi:ABC-type sulfate transport system permease subunit
MNDGLVDVGREAMPKEIRWAVLGLVLLVAFHLVVVPIMWIQSDVIAKGIEASNPNLTPVEVGFALKATLVASLVFHLIFAMLYVWMAFKIHAGRRWARILLSAALVLGTVASVVSFSLSPMFRVLIPIGDLLQIAVIALLWFPRPSREHFAATKKRQISQGQGDDRTSLT